MALPNRTIRIHDLDRLLTTADITSKQTVLIPIASDGEAKETYAIPINSFIQWCKDLHVADKDLNNLSTTGQNILNAKRDFFRTISEDTNFNTFINDGVYRLNVTGNVETNAPVGGGYYVIYVDTNGSDIIEQQARNLSSKPDAVYRRQRISGTWTQWVQITQSVENASFLNAPTVTNEGTNDNQLVTLGQLKTERENTFPTELHISEGLVLSGNISYSEGTLTARAGLKYITNTGNATILENDVSEPISSTGKHYVFIDANRNIVVYDDFKKILDDAKIAEDDALYYVFSNDSYKDSSYTSYSLAPLGTVEDGVFIQESTIQFANIDPLKKLIGEMQAQIESLVGRGKYLSLWDCTTGLAMDEPPVDPYTYENGSYFIVGKVAEEGGTNYKPDGEQYSSSTPSTTVETSPVKPNDTYYYDGSRKMWRLLSGGVSGSFASLGGSPYDNNALATALNSKSTVSVSATGTATDEINYITIDGVQKKIAGSGGGSEEDNLSITKNASNKIQTVGVIDNNNSSTAIKTWTGTLAEYEALTTKNANTLYHITDDVSGGSSVYTKTEVDTMFAKKTEMDTLFANMLGTLYPTGSVYIGTQASCPLASLIPGSTWELVAQDRSLQGSSTNHAAGSTIAAGLPNITGNIQGNGAGNYSASGAFTSNPSWETGWGNSGGTNHFDYWLDASRSSSVYGQSSTVQPPAYVVNVWRRTA